MAKRTYENDEYAAMIRRMIRAYGRRVADGDDVDLTELASMRDALELAIGDAVKGQRARWSWAVIGRALGVTRSAAQQRYGKL